MGTASAEKSPALLARERNLNVELTSAAARHMQHAVTCLNQPHNSVSENVWTHIIPAKVFIRIDCKTCKPCAEGGASHVFSPVLTSSHVSFLSHHHTHLADQ